MTSSKPHRYARTMPWWRSRIIVGSLVSAGAAILSRTGLVHDIAPHDLAAWTDLALTLLSVLGAGVAVHSRIDQETTPKITGRHRP